MNTNQANTLFEILSELRIGDKVAGKPFQNAMKAYYNATLKNIEGKPLTTLLLEFDKKRDLLNWIMGNEFHKLHREQLSLIQKKKEVNIHTNEKEYLISEVATLFKMTPQNLNKHLGNHKEINVRQESPRKRYISETQLKKLKQLLQG